MLQANPIFGVLAPDLVTRRTVSLGEQVSIPSPGGGPGLEIELFAVPGKAPLYLEQAGEVPPIVLGETTVGVRAASGGRTLFFIPGCAAMTPDLARRLDGADVVLFDGTLWRDDEMVRAGLGEKTGRRMGHISVSGPDGAMAAFEGLNIGRKIFIHINNSNPILLEDSPERAAVAEARWDVAHDGMEVEL